MVERIGDQPAHTLDRRQLLQGDVILLLAHPPIDAFEHGEIEPVLAAEVVVDQVLAGADPAGDAIDPRAVEAVGSELGFAMGTCGKDGQGAPVSDAQPTIRLKELTIGGTA